MAKVTKVKRERFILCTFSLFGGGVPTVLEQSNSLNEVCAAIPNHWEEELSICEVIDSVWTIDPTDPTDASPLQVRTLFEVSVNEFPADEEELID